MVREAEQHAREDRQRREEIEERNRADSLAYQAEHTLRDLGEKVPANLRSEVEERIKAVREALNGSDIARVRTTSEELARTTQRIGQEAYAQPEQTATGTAGSSTGSG